MRTPARSLPTAHLILCAAVGLSACDHPVPGVADRAYAADCWETSPCLGTLTVHTVRLTDQCRDGFGPWADTSHGVGAAREGETYLEITATLEAHSAANPDGVLLDQLAYLDPESGDVVTAPLALACREATDGDVFWTKNVQPGDTASLYQPWVVPRETTEIIIEGERFSLTST
ncbi:hypothetical protein [Corynebacterium guangdongense]|uniref:Lipoprotein n=1 Tax=Corynebacterium guangdongense TaxID=1783348 RepID=A0ABU1ZXJ6_9CORY|nr:hypothetical protein [Corynebacterium guangdongense]MDR7329661.1 hypothetical protein [Corynebacterium guangdongense]WJZ18225.1 hypothetical protein CGUA_08320 [Corynebacterium guangdongense]